MNLRDALLNAIDALPVFRGFHLHVLVSAPRRHTALFPFAHPRPKTYLQDVLILLSEHALVPADDARRAFVAAIEAHVYTLPTTACAVLYISKVDTTGQGQGPSPTSALVRALVLYYADPATRPVRADHVWVQLFARAREQYLFPNSAQYPGKRPLSDIRLCAWWRRTLGDAVAELQRRRDARRAGTGEASGGERGLTTKMYYLLPGFSELEAAQSLNGVSSAGLAPPANATEWIYGHPYAQTDIPLPCPPSADDDAAADDDDDDDDDSFDLDHNHNHQQLRWRHLGHCIPSFDDDPKNRFMDEIAYTTEATGVKSPRKKRQRTASSGNNVGEVTTTTADETKKRSERPPGYTELAKVSADEFWERMSFRQECVAGAITGFFAVGITWALHAADPALSTAVTPLEPQPGQVPARLNKRILTDLLMGHEFSTRERAVKATTALELTIRGLCEGLTPVLSAAATAGVVKPMSRRAVAERAKTPEREDQRGQRDALEAPRPQPPSTPPPSLGRRTEFDVSPNPFPEPETSLATYEAHIFGSVVVRNALATTGGITEGGTTSDGKTGTRRAAPEVTVLTVRRKKKRVE